ncbi:hypothetical protein ABZ814_31990 [Micromonospora musae]|uniref:hypothetical protein n=1 Tax=Micromonospora musae TaxID=1894970 RepID=UPI0033D67C5D
MPISPEPRAEYYMVLPAIWRTAVLAGLLPGLDQLGKPPIRYLCVGCLEARIGRRLTAADFTDVPVNSRDPKWSSFAWWWRSPRLSRRLADPGPKWEQMSVFFPGPSSG